MDALDGSGGHLGENRTVWRLIGCVRRRTAALEHV
jgi:hypothetical protein